MVSKNDTARDPAPTMDCGPYGCDPVVNQGSECDSHNSGYLSHNSCNTLNDSLSCSYNVTSDACATHTQLPIATDQQQPRQPLNSSIPKPLDTVSKVSTTNEPSYTLYSDNWQSMPSTFSCALPIDDFFDLDDLDCNSEINIKELEDYLDASSDAETNTFAKALSEDDTANISELENYLNNPLSTDPDFAPASNETLDDDEPQQTLSTSVKEMVMLCRNILAFSLILQFIYLFFSIY